MAIVAPPPELMTSTAQRLLRAAEALGYPASIVTTTSDGPLGLAFQVPDDVMAHYHGVEFVATVNEDAAPGEPFVTVEAIVPQAEVPEEAPPVEEVPVKKTGTRGPRAKATEGSEA